MTNPNASGGAQFSSTLPGPTAKPTGTVGDSRVTTKKPTIATNAGGLVVITGVSIKAGPSKTGSSPASMSSKATTAGALQSIGAAQRGLWLLLYSLRWEAYFHDMKLSSSGG